jgi:hypothetical protein
VIFLDYVLRFYTKRKKQSKINLGFEKLRNLLKSLRRVSSNEILPLTELIRRNAEAATKETIKESCFGP